jgi:hypothetical protein
LVAPFPQDEAGEGVHALIRRRERVMLGQHCGAVRAAEVHRASIAGDHVAVGVLDFEGQAERPRR